MAFRVIVWQTFQERFNIPQFLEFYAATEGNQSLYNVESQPGAVGRIPPFLARRFAVAIIQVDPESGESQRNADGFCIPCATDEPGEAISRIGQRQFDGYTDSETSERKVLHNVFASGNHWFRRRGRFSPFAPERRHHSYLGETGYISTLG